jgi:peptidoglycan/xylan/chitin deacetylase (PgdA/CDA1 family)
MLIIKNITKNILFPVITKLGLEKILSYSSKNKNLILCFHGVSNFRSTINNRHMIVSQFEDLIIYLKNNFEIVSVQHLFLNSKTEKKRIAITFDDGYLNNFTVALPILIKHNIPATFYITTEGLEIENYCMWPEIFDALKIELPKEPIIFNDEEFYFSNNQLLSRKTNISIYDYVKDMGEERQSAFKEFIYKYEVKRILKKLNPELTSFCSSDQIKEMSLSPLVEIGSHTHRHYNLSKINPELAYQELKQSKEILENIIQKPVVSIGYPDGDYSETVKDLAQNAGYLYQLAVTFSDTKDYTDNRIRSRYSLSNTTSLHTNIILINKQFSKVGF